MVYCACSDEGFVPRLYPIKIGIAAGFDERAGGSFIWLLFI